MAEKYGISEAEFKVIQQQAARRAEMRKEFFKQTTNPWKHAAEAGHVFDSAHQRFVSMKATQLDHFKITKSTSLFGIFAIVIPMFSYGYLINKQRTDKEQQIRSGELRYRDRTFKLC